jgi:hypothetical protein
MKIDFIQVVDILFKNKNQWKNLSDKDKEDNFFMVNRKLAVGKPNIASFLNSKFIDKATAMDIWFRLFYVSLEIPTWYWKPKNLKSFKKYNNKLTKSEKNLLLENTSLTNDDIDFMVENYLDDLKYEIKKLKRFNE